MDAKALGKSRKEVLIAKNGGRNVAWPQVIERGAEVSDSSVG